MPKNIILIDKRVQDYETILAAVDTNICIPVLFDYYTDTIGDIKARITEATKSVESVDEATECIANDTVEADAGTPRCVGLLQHNYNRPFYNLVASDAEGSVIMGVTDRDPELATWAPLRDLIAWCGAVYFDMMACALYANPDWKYIIDTLTAQTGVTIRASTDDTGATALGGDWFLESHTGVNLKNIYFTEEIEEYQGVLYLRPYKIRESPTKGFATGSVVAWGETVYGGTAPESVNSGIVAVYSTGGVFAALNTDGSVVAWGNSGINAGTAPGTVTSDVVAVYSTYSAFAALKTTGSVIAWGDSNYRGNSSAVAGSLTSGVVAVYSTYYSFAALKSDGRVVAWGNTTFGGTAPGTVSSGVVAVYSNLFAFVALHLFTFQTPIFLLSYPYKNYL